MKPPKRSSEGHCTLLAFHLATPVHPSRRAITHGIFPTCPAMKPQIFITHFPRQTELLPFYTHRSTQHLQCAVQGWNTLTATEFDARIADNSLAICFVGMSNCGKSHWSRVLQSDRSFHVLSVDEEIELAVEPELKALGYSGIEGLAGWMGFPSDERFSKNQATYLAHEETITAAARPISGSNSILDTTGSVVYLTEQTIARIRDDYLVVHLEASDDMLEVMTESYFETPKPVVWGDAYQPMDGETPNESLRRCYPWLLRERRERYDKMCHVTIPATVSLSRALDLDGLLTELKSRLCTL